MKSFSFLCIYAAAALIGPNTGNAQTADVHSGDRVRVTTRSVLDTERSVYSASTKGNRIIGQLVGGTWDILLVQADDDRLAIPFADIHEVAVSRGVRSSAGSLAMLGGLAGGLFLGALASNDASRCGQWCIMDSGSAFGLGFALGAIGGAMVGAAIGSAIHSERWARLSRNKWMQIRPLTSASGVGLAVSL